MTDTATTLTLVARLEAAREASRALAIADSAAKDAALEAIAVAVETGAARILPTSSTSRTAARTA